MTPPYMCVCACAPVCKSLPFWPSSPKSLTVSLIFQQQKNGHWLFGTALLDDVEFDMCRLYLQKVKIQKSL